MFVLGVDVNGIQPVVINGNEWRNQEEADANGFRVISPATPRLTTTNVDPVPAVDEDFDTMLNSAIFSRDLSIGQALSAGTYR